MRVCNQGFGRLGDLRRSGAGLRLLITGAHFSAHKLRKGIAAGRVKKIVVVVWWNSTSKYLHCIALCKLG